jgi:hypothetical protein
MRARLGERYDLLRARALSYARPDLAAVIVVYRAKLDQMEVPWKK